MNVEAAREYYAQEIRIAAGLKPGALIDAFGKVRREEFLGPGPWAVAVSRAMAMEYCETETADPQHVYHNVAIAIDRARQLNNGQPSSLAFWIEALELKSGSRVFHAGCGTGYYSAVMAEIVGREGRVVAVDVEPELVRRAASNVAGRKNIEVWCADGWEFNRGEEDAILINAGVAHLNRSWLERLAPGGCLVAPLTITMPGIQLSTGVMLKVKKTEDRYDATFLSQVSIYPMVSGRSEESNRALLKAMSARNFQALRSVRLDDHDADETCWCHAAGSCLSKT